MPEPPSFPAGTTGTAGATRAELAGRLTVFGAPESRVVVTIVTQSPGWRLLRALGALAAFWGAAVPAVFVPGAHFVLVPSFLALGVIFFVMRLRQRWAIDSVTGPCPRCGTTQPFVPGSRRVVAQQVTCPACRNNLALTLEGAPAA